MRLSITTAPSVEPVTLTEMKAHLRITGTDDDTDLAIFLQMAREWAENFTRRAFVTQTLTLKLDAFPSVSELELPRPPLSSVTSIKYYNEANVLTTVSAASVYEVVADDIVGRVVLRDGASWPSDLYARTDAVEVVFVAGYGLAVSVPAAVKIAIRALAAHHYENRIPAVAGTIVTSVPFHFEALLWGYRVF